MHPRVPTAVSRASAVAVAAALACAGLAPPAGASPGSAGLGHHGDAAAASRDGAAARRPGRPGPGGLTQLGPAFRRPGTGTAGQLPFVPVGPRPRAARHSDSPPRTLTFNGTNLAGQPDTGGSVQLFSLDGTVTGAGSSARFSNGIAAFSVPAGHYFALANFLDTGKPAPLRIVVLPQIDVAGNTTVTVHEADANSELDMVTPRPAKATATVLWFRRTTALGSPWTLQGVFPGKQQLWLSPITAKTSVGTLRMSVNQHLESPPGHGVPYEYTLSFTSRPGVIPVQHHVLRTKDLATIDERFYQPVKETGGWAFNGSFPGVNANNNAEWFGFIEPAGRGMHFPGRLTEYAGGAGSARMEWRGQYGFRTLPNTLGGSNLLHPGEHLTENWGAFPLHPGVNAVLDGLPNMFWLDGANIPSAVRSGDALQLEVDPFDDSQPGNQIGQVATSGPAQATGTYQIDQNGTTIASGDAVAAAKFGEFYTQVALSPKPSTIRFSLDYTRTSADFPLSTATSTVWTWHSAPVTGGQVPPGWSCVRFTYRPDGCAAEPMMTLGYAVANMGLDGAAPAGHQTLHLTVGHLQAAVPSKITKVTVSVSFDGGKTWHPATVTGSGNSYTAGFTAPAGAMVTLRTRASDAAGGSITESITSAYQTAP